MTSRHLESYGYSDIGLVRENNEDIWIALPQYGFYAIADGMGGHNAGEVAAKETLENLCHSVKKSNIQQSSFTIEELVAHLRDAVQQANRWVFNLGKKHERYRGMGTTLCCLYFYQDKVVYAHVGDSRIYRFRDNCVQQLTEDHSLVSELIATGYIEGNETKTSSYKNVITKAIGTSSSVEPEIAFTTAKSNDIFFMCTDGLSDFITEKEFDTVLNQSISLEEKAKKLIEKAKENESNDNISIVLVTVGENGK